MASEPVVFEFTAKERGLIKKYGYPFPALAKALDSIANSRKIEEIEITDFELNQLIGDISQSINDGLGGPGCSLSYSTSASDLNTDNDTAKAPTTSSSSNPRSPISNPQNHLSLLNAYSGIPRPTRQTTLLSVTSPLPPGRIATAAS